MAVKSWSGSKLDFFFPLFVDKKKKEIRTVLWYMCKNAAKVDNQLTYKKNDRLNAQSLAGRGLCVWLLYYKCDSWVEIA